MTTDIEQAIEPPTAEPTDTPTGTVPAFQPDRTLMLLLLVTSRAERVLHAGNVEDPARARAQLDEALAEAWALLRPIQPDGVPLGELPDGWRPGIAGDLPGASYDTALAGAAEFDAQLAAGAYGKMLVAHTVAALHNGNWLTRTHESLTEDYIGHQWTAPELRRALLAQQPRMQGLKSQVGRLNRWILEHPQVILSHDENALAGDEDSADIVLRLLDRLLDRAVADREQLTRAVADISEQSGIPVEPTMSPIAAAITFLEALEFDASRYKADALAASVTVAEMHAAAVGDTTGPVLGVVEDVRQVRERMLAAEHVLIQADAATALLADEIQGYRWREQMRTEPGQATGPTAVFVQFGPQVGAHVELTGHGEKSAAGTGAIVESSQGLPRVEVPPPLAQAMRNIASVWPAVYYDANEAPEWAAVIEAAAKEAGLVAVPTTDGQPRTMRGGNLPGETSISEKFFTAGSPDGPSGDTAAAAA